MESFKHCNPCMRNGLQDECILYHLQHMLAIKPSSYRRCLEPHTQQEPEKCQKRSAKIEVWSDSDKGCIDKIFKSPFPSAGLDECPGGYICDGESECPGCPGKNECDSCKPKNEHGGGGGGGGSGGGSGGGGGGSGGGGSTNGVDPVDPSLADYDPIMMPYDSIFYPLGPCGPKTYLCPYVPLSAPVKDSGGSGKGTDKAKVKIASNQLKKTANKRGSIKK